MNKYMRPSDYKEAYESLELCPVCGRVPIIYRDHSYEECGFGARCTIQCKPFLRKPHMKTEVGEASWDRALKYAVEHWNLFVKTGIKPGSAAAHLHDRQKEITNEIHELIDEEESNE